MKPVIHALSEFDLQSFNCSRRFFGKDHLCVLMSAVNERFLEGLEQVAQASHRK